MVVLSICILNFSSNFSWNALILKKCLYIEEYLVSVIAALWIFYLFKLKIALLLWVVVYLLINLFFTKNLIIKSAYTIDTYYVTHQFESGILIHKNLWKIKNFFVSSWKKKAKFKTD